MAGRAFCPTAPGRTTPRRTADADEAAAPYGGGPLVPVAVLLPPPSLDTAPAGRGRRDSGAACHQGGGPPPEGPVGGHCRRCTHRGGCCSPRSSGPRRSSRTARGGGPRRAPRQPQRPGLLQEAGHSLGPGWHVLGPLQVRGGSHLLPAALQ